MLNLCKNSFLSAVVLFCVFCLCFLRAAFLKCTWCKRADGVGFGLSGTLTPHRGAGRQQLQDTGPLSGTVQQLPAALTQGLEGRDVY